jgi:hypothetical protein
MTTRIGIVVAAAAMVVASPAYAAPTIFNLTDADSSAGLGAGPYGTVSVEAVGGSLNFILTLAAGYRIHDGNANHNAFAFSITGDPNVTITNLTSGFAAINTTSGTNVTSPPFGSFFTAIDCTTACSAGFAGGYTGTLSFTVSSSSALSIASLANNSGIFFTTDVVIANGNTGNVGARVSTTPPLPEPATWAMIIGGFGAMGFALRRRPKVAMRIRYA